MAQKYFSGLNYTLGNEDTSVEIKMILEEKPEKIFSICGSGGRSLPLMHEGCEVLSLADLSQEQLFLAECRLLTYAILSHEDFLLFWGYYPYSDNNHKARRRELFASLPLTPKAHAFLSQVFHEIHFDSLLYLGKWESTFAVFAKICKVLLGPDHDRIMRFDHLDDQIYYYKNAFPMNRWKALIHLLGNKAMFNALLYKGDFIKKNSPLSHFDYYFKAFERLFTTDLAQRSFFLQLCFYGKISSLLGVPVEAHFESHDRVKKASSHTNVQYVKEDFVSYLKRGETKYNFLSLSDVPSYFSGELEAQFMQLIKPSLAPGAIIVLRNYLRSPVAVLQGFDDVTANYKSLIEFEKVQMYEIKVYKFNS